jgi:hypothetical protein
MVSTAVLVFALGGFGNCLGIRDIAGYLDRSGHNAVCQSPRQNIRHVVFVARVRHPNDESKLVRDRIRFPSTPALVDWFYKRGGSVRVNGGVHIVASEFWTLRPALRIASAQWKIFRADASGTSFP